MYRRAKSAFDVMTHNRPYHQRMSEQAALAKLEEVAGSQFDPDLVAEFVCLLEKDGEDLVMGTSNAQMGKET